MAHTDPQSLMREYRRVRDPRLREAIVTRFLPLSRSLARRFASGGEPLEDLEQVAALALIRAVDAFDIDRGTAFSSYAVPSVAGAIKRHFRDACWSVRPPRELQELALRVAQLNDELSAANGSAPTAAQIAELAGVEVEAVLEAREAYRAQRSDSLDRPGPAGDDAGSMLDAIGTRDAEIRRAFDRVALDALMASLDERKRAIVQLYYQQELTQAEIGRRLGYSQMHISRLLRQAVDELLMTASAQQYDYSHSSAA